VEEGDALIVAAGAWVARLCPDLGRRVTPSRQVVVYLEAPPALASAWASAPMVLDIAPHAGFYLAPPRAGAGLKIGDHRFSSAGDPDARREASEDDVQTILALCHSRLRDPDAYRVKEARVCFYTIEARERFLVERAGPTWWVSACSGHGFKFGP